MNTLSKSDIDLSGTAEAMTNERISLAKAVYPAIPYRYNRQ